MCGSDEDEAVLGQTVAPLGFLDLLPGPAALMVPDRLPVEQNFLVVLQAVSLAASRVVLHGRRFTRHTHFVPLCDVAHPVCVWLVLHRAVGGPGLKGELHTEPGVEGVSIFVVFGPPFAKLHAGDECRACVVCTVFSLQVSVLPAASLLPQIRTRPPAVTGLILHVSDPDPH